MISSQSTYFCPPILLANAPLLSVSCIYFNIGSPVDNHRHCWSTAPAPHGQLCPVPDTGEAAIYWFNGPDMLPAFGVIVHILQQCFLFFCQDDSINHYPRKSHFTQIATLKLLGLSPARAGNPDSCSLRPPSPALNFPMLGCSLHIVWPVWRLLSWNHPSLMAFFTLQFHFADTRALDFHPFSFETVSGCGPFLFEDLVHGLQCKLAQLFDEVLSEVFYLLTQCGIGVLIIHRCFIFLLIPPEFG